MPKHTPAKRAANKRVARKIRTLRKEGRPRRQAVAIALKRRKRK